RVRQWHPRIAIRTLYLRTLHFRTAVPDWVLGFRSLGTVAPHPDSQGTRNGHGSGLRGRRRTDWERWKGPESTEQIHLRFQAVVIASQLPDNRAEALLVLDYA